MNRAEKRRKAKKEKKTKAPDTLTEEAKQQIQDAIDALHSNQFESGFQLTTKLLKRYPKNIDLLNIHALLAIELGDLEIATTYLQKAITLAPYNPNILNNLAKIKFETKQFDHALKLYEQAKLHAPYNEKINANIAKVWEEKGCFKEAIETYTELLKANPIQFDSLKALAQIYHKIGSDDNAIETYKMAYKLDSNDLVISRNLMLLISKTDQWKEGEEYVNDFNKLNWAYTLMEKKEFTKAIQIYQKAIEENPDDYESLINTSNCYLSLNEIDKAIIPLKNALEKSPKEPLTSIIYINLGSLYLENKEYENALETLNKVLKTNNRNHLLATLLSKVHEAIGNKKEALQFLAQSVELKPSKESIEKLGKEYWRNGLPEEVIETHALLRSFSSQDTSLDELHYKSLLLTGELESVQNLLETNYHIDLSFKEHLLGTLKEYQEHSIESARQHYQTAHQHNYTHHISSYQNLLLWKDALQTLPSLKSKKREHPPIFLFIGTSLYTPSLLTNHLSHHSKAKTLSISNAINKVIEHLTSLYKAYPKALENTSLEKYKEIFLKELPTLEKENFYFIDPLPEYTLHLPLLTSIFPNLHLLILKEPILKESWEIYRQESSIGLFPSFEKAIEHCKDQHTLLQKCLSQYTIKHTLLEAQNKKDLLKEISKSIQIPWEEAILTPFPLTITEYHPELLSLFLNTPFNHEHHLTTLKLLEETDG